MPHKADNEWLSLLVKIWDRGSIYAPRGLPIKEILCNTTVMDMRYPVVTLKERKMGYRFLAGEAKWIIEGDNRVETIVPYTKNIAQFSDDGVYFNGAYGPQIVDQLPYVVDTLLSDQDTRQAVLTIWRPNPRPSKDIPCTTQLQWFIRDNKVHCIDTMRSSDAWLGWVYDVFNMSMLTGYIMLLMRQRKQTKVDVHNLKIGNLYLNAGSHHIYERNFEAVEEIVNGFATHDFEYAPFEPFAFESPQALVRHLGHCADDQPLVEGDFLKEIYGDAA